MECVLIAWTLLECFFIFLHFLSLIRLLNSPQDHAAGVMPQLVCSFTQSYSFTLYFYGTVTY